MNLELAIRMTEMMLAFAFIQQSAEHMMTARERHLFAWRMGLSLLLLVGYEPQFVCLALVVHALFVLQRFQGPYNGGSDRMGLLILCCLTASHWLSPEYGMGYLALQSLLSYFIAGWVKFKNPDWRSGLALQDVFGFSAYPVSESLRGWADKHRMMKLMSWGVIGLEMLFPLSLLSMPSLVVALVLAAGFHLANACLFGLNRFFWVWLAAYPSILWLQGRVWGV